VNIVKKALWLALFILIVVGVFLFRSQSKPYIDPKKVAEDAYVYGLQQAVFYATRYNFTQLENSPSYVGINSLYWLRSPITADFKEVVTPNATTLYGAGFLDLSQEPVVLNLPAIKDRYWSFQSMDQYGDYFFYAGNQFTGNDKQMYIFVGPDWNGVIPENFSGKEIIKTPSNSVFIISRIALMEHSNKEVQLINSYQDQIITTPLTDWLNNGSKEVPFANRSKIKGQYQTFPGLEKLVVQLVEKQTAMEYFKILNFVLNDKTMTKRADSHKELETLKLLRTIGIGENLVFDSEKLSRKKKTALEKGFYNGKTKIKKAIGKSGASMNSWIIPSGMGEYGTNYVVRAVVGDAGWAGPGVKSHNGAICFVDSENQQLNGKYKYTLTFDSNNLPPVTEFWSIPIYDITGYFIPNELNRYTVNSFMYDRGDFYIENNKLVFYIQKNKPTNKNMLKNWLPAPDGDFRFTARFYGPKAPLINGRYDMPRAVKVK